jgi:hypothetical protein
VAAEGAATPTSGPQPGPASGAAPAPDRPIRAIWLWLFGLAAFLVLTGPVLDPDLQLYFRDTVRLHYPVKRYIAERLLAGELPLWDPWTAAGQSLLGQLSPGLFHPFTLLYLLLPFDLAFKLNHLLALPAAGIGAWLLSRRLGASPLAALVGAVGYGGCGFLVSMAGANVTYAVGPAMVPWAVAGLLWLAERPGPGRLLAASAGLASCVWAGDPQSAYVAALIGGGYLAARPLLGAASAAGEARPVQLSAELRPRALGLLRSLGLAAAWAASALVFAAPSLAPALPSLARSARRAGLTAEERGAYNVQPLRLLTYLLPQTLDSTLGGSAEEVAQAAPSVFDLFSNGSKQGFADSLTFGPPLFLLALAGLGAGRRSRFLLLGALLFGLLSTGDALGVDAAAQAVLPGLSLFRYGEKLAAPCTLLVAVAASLGADLALGSGRRSALCALLAFAAAGLFGALAAFAQAGQEPLANWLLLAGSGHQPWLGATFARAIASGLLLSAGLSALLGLVVALGTRPAPLPAIARWALPLTCLCASLTWSSRLLCTAPVALLREPPPLAQELLRRAGPSAGRWRLYADLPTGFAPPAAPGGDHHLRAMAGQLGSLQPQTAALFGIEGTDDYFSLDDRSYNAILQGATPQALALLGTRFVVGHPAQGSSQVARSLGFLPAAGGHLVRENLETARAVATFSARVVPDLERLIPGLRELPADRPDEALLLERDAILASGLPPESLPRPASGRPLLPLVARRPRPERIELEADLPAPAIVTYAEHFDPGWSAAVDGQPSPLGAVDGLILGVAVPAGRHRVVLTFFPRHLGPALAAATVGALLLLAAALHTARRDKKCQSVDSSRQQPEGPSSPSN